MTSNRVSDVSSKIRDLYCFYLLLFQCLKTTGDYIRRTRLLLKDFFHEESLCNGTGLCINEARVPASNGIFIKDVNDKVNILEKE
ncbi:hypothetical protein DsansV1_C06g0061951 [Dioscorea sansibarensis]